MVKITGTEKCNPGTGQYNINFREYIRQCTSLNDESRLNNLVDTAVYSDTIQNLRDVTNDLIISVDNIQNMHAKTGTTVSQLDREINSLMQTVDTLNSKKKTIETETQANDRSFLDHVISDVPTNESFPTLQDISIALFLFGWLVLGLSLLTIRTIGPSGSFRGGALVLLLFLFVTFLLYAILKVVA